MPADFNHKSYILPKFRTRDYRVLMIALNNALGFDTSDKAQFRFHVLRLFYTSGWRSVKLAFPNLTRPTVYRWKRDYERSGKKLSSLIPKSTRPHRARQMLTVWQVTEYIGELRQKYPRLGKGKVKIFLDHYCQTQGYTTIGATTIGKVIRRKHYFFQKPVVGVKSHRKRAKRQRINHSPKGVNLGHLQVDGIKFFYLAKYYYLLTAVEVVSRQSWVVLVPAFASVYARDFLVTIINQTGYPIHTIQTDNGSEFLKLFDQAVTELGLTHLFSYPHCPKVQGYVERFNRTLQEEFLVYNLDALLTDEFNDQLTSWLVYYNQVRPHYGLNLMTPYQFLIQKGVCLKSM